MEYELARSFYSLARAVLSVELRGRVAGRMIDIQRSKSSRGFHPETVDGAPLRLCKASAFLLRKAWSMNRRGGEESWHFRFPVKFTVFHRMHRCISFHFRSYG